jgi:hypothetical protein
MATKMTFRQWLAEAESGVRTFLKPNPKNPSQKFLVLYGNTFSIKDEISKLGFRYFQGTWSIPDFKLTPEIKGKLVELGVDMSGSEHAQEFPKVAPVMRPQDTKAGDIAPETQTDKLLNNMKVDVDKAMSDASNPQLKTMLQSIDKVIEQVANMADEAGKQEFIQNFLKFSSKFHHYSLHNQLLIWIYSHGKAEYVAGASNWPKLGRTVTKWDEGIWILRPNFKKITKKVQDPTTGEEKDEEFSLKRFKAAKVYDVSATEPIPGHPSPFQPVTRADWSKDTNETREEIDVMVNALVDYIKSKKLDLDYKQMAAEVGGYSAGGKIRINNTFKGINLFGTLVHETAHELLHWMETERGYIHSDKIVGRKEKEIDAETTAYVVLHHFGFESKSAPNYLALWQAKSEDIRQRKSEIQKAASEIITGIKVHMANRPLELSPEEAA